MTIKNIECADCGAPVPYGRLACPSCGALLAAVSGGPPPAVRVVETPAPVTTEPPDLDGAPVQKSRAKSAPKASSKEPVTREHAGMPAAANGTTKSVATGKTTPPPAPVVATPAPAAAVTPPALVAAAPAAASSVAAAPARKAPAPPPAPAPAQAPEPPTERSSTSSAPVAAQLAYLVEPSPDAPNYVIPARAQGPAPGPASAAPVFTPAPAAATAVAVEAEPYPSAPAGNGRSHAADDLAPNKGRTYLEPEPPIRGSSGYVIDDPYGGVDDDEATDSPWPPLLQPEPTIVARPYGEPANGNGTPRPGAYLPPNAPVAGSVPTAAAMARVAASSDSTSGGPLPATELAAGAAGGATAAVAIKAPNRFDPVGTITAAFAGIDRARIAEVAGWFVVAGSTVALLGFLLPWSAVVIGSRGNGGYLDDWGLASPTHLFAVLGLAGVLALGVLQNPVPVWLRTGVLGLLTGGLLVGLTWPYAIGPLGAELGAMATFVGGLLLIGGGLVASWATRHAEAVPGV